MILNFTEKVNSCDIVFLDYKNKFNFFITFCPHFHHKLFKRANFMNKCAIIPGLFRIVFAILSISGLFHK